MLLKKVTSVLSRRKISTSQMKVCGFLLHPEVLESALKFGSLQVYFWYARSPRRGTSSHKWARIHPWSVCRDRCVVDSRRERCAVMQTHSSAAEYLQTASNEVLFFNLSYYDVTAFPALMKKVLTRRGFSHQIVIQGCPSLFLQLSEC